MAQDKQNSGKSQQKTEPKKQEGRKAGTGRTEEKRQDQPKKR